MTRFKLSLVEALMLALTCVYIFLFYQSISPFLFSEMYTTDDARQQLYPLWQVIYRDAFKNDPVTLSMRGYLPPLHWELSFLVTLLTRSPVMTGHVVMCIQLTLALVFLSLLVKSFSSIIPAFFSIIWFLHSRNLPQRLTGGLPRGWAPAILTSFLYFLGKKSQVGVLIVLLIGILTNPPAAFLCAVCYGAFLTYQFITPQTRAATKTPFLRFLLVCPVFAVVALLSLKRPPEFGHMATLAEAESNPAFNAAGGRFPFIPLKSPFTELKTVGTQAFQNKWHHLPSFFGQDQVLIALFLTLIVVYIISVRKKKELIPLEFNVYLFSIFTVYFLSRFFAFQLYVPDRHLQYPLNIFWIVFFCVLIWRLAKEQNLKRWQVRATYYFLIFGALLYLLGGDGLEGTANFNTKLDSHQRLYAWMRLNTERSDVFAGHPKEIDLLPLASVRVAYITEETAHPFYDGYWKLVKSRLEKSFEMLYASTPAEFLQAKGEEKIDYFIFMRSRFAPKSIQSATCFSPIGNLVKRLVRKNQDKFLFTKLADGNYPKSVVYQDNDVIVIKPDLLTP